MASWHFCISWAAAASALGGALALQGGVQHTQTPQTHVTGRGADAGTAATSSAQTLSLDYDEDGSPDPDAPDPDGFEEDYDDDYYDDDDEDYDGEEPEEGNPDDGSDPWHEPWPERRAASFASDAPKNILHHDLSYLDLISGREAYLAAARRSLAFLIGELNALRAKITMDRPRLRRFALTLLDLDNHLHAIGALLQQLQQTTPEGWGREQFAITYELRRVQGRMLLLQHYVTHSR